jgi:hypothetical protein
MSESEPQTATIEGRAKRLPGGEYAPARHTSEDGHPPPAEP